jgi:HlyD family secretion protein
MAARHAGCALGLLAPIVRLRNALTGGNSTMTTDMSKSPVVGARPTLLDRRGPRIAAAIVCTSGLLWGSGAVYKRVSSGSSSSPGVATVVVDRGDVTQVVTENGSIESSDDDVVRCRVESFLGLPVAPAPTGIHDARAPAARLKATAGVVSSGSAGGPVIVAAFGTRSRAQAPVKSEPAMPKSRAPVAPRLEESPLQAGTPEADATSGQTAGSASVNGPKRPVIRSFERTIEPHVPLRSTLPGQGVIAATAPPPPTILTILPEGTSVRAGDIVCELDSSAFRQALEVQQIRYVQAKAWVEQARYLLEANEIALREYREGVLPQDIALVRKHIVICESQRDRAAQNFAWARTVFARGFLSEAHVDAGAAQVQLAEIALGDAQGTLERLTRYTGKRVLKAHTAKIAAIRADLLSLESSFRLERERKERIEAMIANCKMRAPLEGIVAYAHRVNAWGTVEARIREGQTVYQSQPIFRLLDPRRMYVKARINESQIGLVRAGQPVSIRLDAFPDRVLNGKVAEIMPIPSPANGPFSDVRFFSATVRIESGGFDELRSGLNAELEFVVKTRRGVPRVPLEAIRWIDDRPCAGTVVATGNGLGQVWRPVELGVRDTAYAEVVSGLEPGDRVVAHADHQSVR